MAKLIEYDVSNVESSGGGGEEPKPAVYVAKIMTCEQRDVKADGSPASDIHVVLNLGGDYRWLHTYIGLNEASDWKLKEFVNALDLKEKGKLDPKKQEGKLIRVKVNPDSYEGQYQAKAGRLMKPQDGDELAEASETSTDPEEDGPVADEDVAGGAGAADFTREDPDDESIGSYDDWPDEDLEAEVSDRDLTVSGGRGKKRDKWIAALRSDDEEVAAGGDDETETSGETGDDYDEWPVEDLEAEAVERELEVPDKPRGRNAADRHVANLIALLRKDDEDNPFDPDAK